MIMECLNKFMQYSLKQFICKQYTNTCQTMNHLTIFLQSVKKNPKEKLEFDQSMSGENSEIVQINHNYEPKVLKGIL